MKLIDEFSKLADRYCSWTDSLQKEDTVDLGEVLALLSELFNNALVLPLLDSGETDEEAERLTQDEWKLIHKKYTPIPFQYYNEIFDPHDFSETKPVVGDLHDDLADIYRYLKQGLILYEKGLAGDAAFEWKSSFSYHWGEHVLSAMRAIYMFER
jgi:hypothetical protein